MSARQRLTTSVAQPSAAATERETFATTGIDIGVLRESTRARAYVDGTIDYYAYDSDEFSNETAGALDAGLSHSRGARGFFLGVQQTASITRASIRSRPSVPEIASESTRFSTGPRASIPLGERNRLGIVSQYSDRRYQESDTLEGDTRAASWTSSHELSADATTRIFRGGT